MADAAQKISSWKKEKNRDILSILPLCMVLVAGSLLSWFKIAQIAFFYEVISFWMAELSLCLTGFLAAVLFGKNDKKWAFLVPACEAAAVAVFRPLQVFHGFLGFLNICIYSWNQKYQDGVRMFNDIQATQQNLFLYSLVFALILAAVLWYFVSVKACFKIGVFALLLFVPEIVLEKSSPAGAVLMLTSIVGIWLFSFRAGSFLRRTGWTFCVSVLLVGVLLVSRGKNSQTVLDGKKAAIQLTEQLRYGKDNMPSGDLNRAAYLEQGDEPRLQVRTEQIKPIYFKGYTGSYYENGIWKPLTKAAYGGDRWGFLKWLKGRGFSPQHQYISYEEAGKSDADALPQDAPWMNHIQVVNNGAVRKYIYEPYSAQAAAKTVSQRDEGSRSLLFFGTKRYEISELSSDVPGELQRLDSWVEFPQTEEQKQYLESEAVYRDFVYENYVTVDPELSSLIQELFHKENSESTPSVYSAVQSIRSILEENTYYSNEISLENDNGDLLREFLQGERRGNSAYYTSASVLALRSFHIPARYAEGYLLTSRQAENSRGDWISLSSSSSHAWVEVYMDGMGWVPVDMTPGYYYDTYALLDMAQSPGQVRKVAAQESDGEEAENLKKHFPGGEGASGEEIQKKENADTGWGLVILVLILMELAFTVLELRRLYYEYQIRRYGKMDHYPDADFLFRMIYRHLLIFHIDMQPGFESRKIQSFIDEKILDMPEGLYLRVNELMEKYFYGEEKLEEYEVRLLYQFLLKLRDNRKKMGIFTRLRLRYCIFS